MPATNTPATPAFAPTQTMYETTARKRRKVSGAKTDEILKALEDQQKRAKDLLVPYRQLKAVVIKHDDTFQLGLSVEDKNKASKFRIYEPVVDQICVHTSINDSRTLPGAYLSRMLQDQHDESLVKLAAENVNRWLEKRAGEHRKNRKGENVVNGEKQCLVRLLCDNKGEYLVRALLSDRYFTLPNLAIIMAAFTAITGKDGKDGEIASATSVVRGAVMFDWALTPFDLDMGFMNPRFAFDLKHPDKGVIEVEDIIENGSSGHTFVYAGGHKYTPGQKPDDDGTHMVMPAAFISNSETGGGSASVEMSLLEQYCENSARLSAFSRRHTGQRIVKIEDYESDITRKNTVKLVTSQFTDAMRQVFDMKEFEKNCRSFLGLFDKDIKSVEETSKWALTEIGALDLLKDVMNVYEQFNRGRNTLGDVQRGLTAIAQDQPIDKANKMMTFAGDLLTGDAQIPNDLLVAK